MSLSAPRVCKLNWIVGGFIDVVISPGLMTDSNNVATGCRMLIAKQLNNLELKGPSSQGHATASSARAL